MVVVGVGDGDVYALRFGVYVCGVAFGDDQAVAWFEAFEVGFHLWRTEVVVDECFDGLVVECRPVVWGAGFASASGWFGCSFCELGHSLSQVKIDKQKYINILGFLHRQNKEVKAGQGDGFVCNSQAMIVNSPSCMLMQEDG